MARREVFRKSGLAVEYDEGARLAEDRIIFTLTASARTEGASLTFAEMCKLAYDLEKLSKQYSDPATHAAREREAAARSPRGE
jgi:hypothetical protein